MSDDRNVALDIIRIICCVMVIVIHMPEFYAPGCRIVVHVMTHYAVPCFMAVSGYLIFFRREYSYKQILSGPFKKYLIIFLLWFIIYTIYSYSLTDRGESFWRYAIINSEGGHLWYLKVYLQIIVAYPLIRAITSRKELVLFYSVLWFVFLPVRYTIGHIPGVEFTFLRVIQLPFFQYSGPIGGTLFAYYPTECLGIFIAGGGYLAYLEEFCKKEGYSSRFKSRLRFFISVGLLGFIVALMAAYTAYQINEEQYPMSVTCFHFYFFMMVIGLIAGVYLLLSHIRSDKFSYAVKIFSDKTLGIYILHPLVCSLLSRWISIEYLSEYARNGVITAFTIIISFLIVAIMHRVIPKKIMRYIF